MPESDLTRALRAVFGQPEFRVSLAGLDDGQEPGRARGSAHQVFLARKFYNDAVAATRRPAAGGSPGGCAWPAGAEAPEFFRSTTRWSRPAVTGWAPTCRG